MTITKPRRSAFATSLLEEWRRLALPVSEASVVVAVSGGADSTALLLGLDELIKQEKLQLKLIVAHLDHGLREASRKDAQWVAQLAQDLGYEAVISRVTLAREMKARLSTRTKSPTKQPSQNLEQAARNARYAFLQKTASKHDSSLVLTAHTLDDQAETILMRLLRGSAAEGLSGTPAVRQLERSSPVKLVRPLLSWARRSDTENFCRYRQIGFRLDDMNEDETFSRVRVRKQLLPLMKSFNNRVVETLSRTAALLNEDAAALSGEAERLLELALRDSELPGNGPSVREPARSPIVGKASRSKRTSASLAHANAAAAVVTNRETIPSALSVSVLRQAPPAIRRRALREWILRTQGHLKRVEMVHLVAIEKLLQGERGGRVAELPGGMVVKRGRGLLELSRKKVLKKTSATPKILRGHRLRSRRRS